MAKWTAAVLIVAMGAGCRRAATDVVATSAPPQVAKKSPKYPARIHPKRAPETIARPEKSLSLADAQKYFVELVNRDRQAEGLEPVTWDPVAERAGKVHAVDMAMNGYTSHYGTDGSVPELRYTRVGGDGMVQENAACFFDEKRRKLDPNPVFSAEAIEKAEASFMNEKPPHDGHRKNILTPWHNRLGIGLVQPVDVPIPCVAQEFVDHYGSYSAVPSSAAVGDAVQVTGTIAAPAVFAGVGVARIDTPAPRKPGDLNAIHTYPVPEPYATYFPRGFVTPIPVHVEGDHFSIDVPLD